MQDITVAIVVSVALIIGRKIDTPIFQKQHLFVA